MTDPRIFINIQKTPENLWLSNGTKGILKLMQMNKENSFNFSSHLEQLNWFTTFTAPMVQWHRYILSKYDVPNNIFYLLIWLCESNEWLKIANSSTSVCLYLLRTIDEVALLMITHSLIHMNKIDSSSALYSFGICRGLVC